MMWNCASCLWGFHLGLILERGLYCVENLRKYLYSKTLFYSLKGNFMDCCEYKKLLILRFSSMPFVSTFFVVIASPSFNLVVKIYKIYYQNSVRPRKRNIMQLWAFWFETRSAIETKLLNLEVKSGTVLRIHRCKIR